MNKWTCIDELPAPTVQKCLEIYLSQFVLIIVFICTFFFFYFVLVFVSISVLCALCLAIFKCTFKMKYWLYVYIGIHKCNCTVLNHGWTFIHKKAFLSLTGSRWHCSSFHHDGFTYCNPTLMRWESNYLGYHCWIIDDGHRTVTVC